MPEGPQVGLVISLMASACMFQVNGDNQYAQIHLDTTAQTSHACQVSSMQSSVSNPLQPSAPHPQAQAEEHTRQGLRRSGSKRRGALCCSTPCR